MTTPKPTPAAMEAAKILHDCVEHEAECEPSCPESVAQLAVLIQTHACDPSFRAGQIAGLEWAASTVPRPAKHLRYAIQDEIARLKGEGGDGR